VRHLPEEPGLRGLVPDAAGADPAEVEVWRKGQPVPVAIQRLIDEVRNEALDGVPRSYNRIYNRHNRS
jgi:ABC-type amino acid transport substrate-binding protein